MTLKEIILLTHEYYHRGHPLSDQVLLMYAGDLSDLNEQQCVGAYTQWRRNPKNTKAPLPAEIRELVNPEQFVAIEAQARELAARVVGAIPKFGWCNPKEAKLYIGDIGWQLVERHGGWRYLCENVGVIINPAVLQAQIRDQAEGEIRYGSNVIAKKIGALSEIESKRGGELVPIGSGLRALIGEPKEPA